MMKTALGTGVALFLGQAVASVAPHVPGEMIIKLKKDADKSFLSNKSYGISVDRTIELSNETLYVVSYDKNINLLKMIDNLESVNGVEYAEPNFIYSIVKPMNKLTLEKIEYDVSQLLDAPNDPMFNKLWGLKNTGDNEPGGSSGTVGADVDAMKAWSLTKGDRRVKVAVIDTGIDYNHPDLRENMWVNEAEKNGKDGVDDDGNGYVDDIYGYDFANNDGDPVDGHSHGTHCAGTIGAVHDNGTGVAGVMNDVTLVAIKFLSDSGSGTTEAAIKAIDYATKLGVDVMSNSWGGGGRSQALEDAIRRANDKGIVFVAAAGNSRSNNDQTPHYPSNYDVDNVISVAAHTAQDNLASFSCFGRRTVHVAAPGHNILSTVKSGGYESYSGTSMATPHVSGAVGLLLASVDGLSPAQVKERVMATSVPVASYRGKTIYGGRLNAYNLLTDTRPERNIPNPDSWESVDLDDRIESDHPYSDNTAKEWTVSQPGAKYMRVRIKKYDTEARYDYIEVVDSKGNSIEKVSGEGQNYETDYVEGDSLTIRFVSDRSVSKWGFEIEQVDVQY